MLEHDVLRWRGIRKHRNYTIEEIARALGVARGTVRRWTKSGLPTCDDQRPLLVIGEDLISFLVKQKAARKRPCKLHECYCVKCRDPRVPAGLRAELVMDRIASGNLRAKCPVCGTLMNKRIATSALEYLCTIFSVTVVQGGGHIAETEPATVSDHSSDAA